MEFLDQLAGRNARFAETAFVPDLRMMPSTGTIVVGCVDPRVDPAAVLGLEQGEAAVIRNVGGRVTRNLIETLGILRVVAQAAGREGGVRNLVLLHHTDCGIIGCYHHAPELLARHMGVETAALDDLAVTDPYKAVVQDIATLKAQEQLADTIVVTGLVYDVATGLMETVVTPAPLRLPPSTSK
jgi:carbonic anhydrase